MQLWTLITLARMAKIENFLWSSSSQWGQDSVGKKVFLIFTFLAHTAGKIASLPSYYRQNTALFRHFWYAYLWHLITLARKVEMEKKFHFNYFWVHSGQKCEPTIIFLAISPVYYRQSHNHSHFVCTAQDVDVPVLVVWLHSSLNKKYIKSPLKSKSLSVKCANLILSNVYVLQETNQNITFKSKIPYSL